MPHDAMLKNSRICTQKRMTSTVAAVPKLYVNFGKKLLLNWDV